MNTRKITTALSLALLFATTAISALEIGHLKNNYPSGLKGMINIKLNDPNPSGSLNVKVEGVSRYDLVPAEGGAAILFRPGEIIPEEFTVTAKYGYKKASRSYTNQVRPRIKGIYDVRPNDTLSNISERIKANTGGTFHQRALALITANTWAFEKRNPTMLKSKVTMTIPSQEQVMSASDREAKAQYRKWLATGNDKRQITKSKKIKKEPDQNTSIDPLTAMAGISGQAKPEQIPDKQAMLANVREALEDLPTPKKRDSSKAENPIEAQTPVDAETVAADKKHADTMKQLAATEMACTDNRLAIELNTVVAKENLVATNDGLKKLDSMITDMENLLATMPESTPSITRVDQ